MKWFNGGISDAIQQAKDKIFVVFVEGLFIIYLFKRFDEFTFECLFLFLGDDTSTSSQDLSSLIDAKNISEKLESQQFVAIKIKSDTPEYFNFAKICKYTSSP